MYGTGQILADVQFEASPVGYAQCKLGALA